MRLFKKVAIVGTGLIGGSIALAIKKQRLAGKIIGVSRHNESLVLAKKIGAIDYGSRDLEILKDADLVVLSTPVNKIMELAPRIAKIIPKDCIVFDVGSTKQEIVRKLDRIFSSYVGTHPLAGSEKRGVINSKAGIFKGSLCILTPTVNTNKKAFLKIRKLFVRFGSKIFLLSSADHDRVLAFVSHLAHISAFSLINAVPGEYLKFSAGGLKDTTRIAASDSEVWADIFLSNRRNILRAIELLQNNLSKIKLAIMNKDRKAIDLILKQAKGKRDNL